ncbi:MAG: hypothetical protein IKD92_01990 [Lachnospiraceae bacterium]|nr:hypothetical protein [Lachnospiraceae bacterium]
MKRLPERIREILSKRRVRRFLTRVVSIVGALVVFATTYALVLPAITMEKQAACGIEEHQHDDSCFELQLICGEEESETHQHTDECYERVLVCEKPVHTHSTECYETFEETYEEPADTDAGTEEDTMSGQTAGTDSSETENGTEAAAADGIRDTDSTGASDENTDRDETGSEKADAKDIDPSRSGSTEDSDDSDKEFTEKHKSSSSKVQADAVNPEDGTIEGESLDAAEVAVTEDKTYAGLQTTLDLAGVLSDRTGLYYYPAKYDEDGIADTTAIRSDSATDWEKVKDDTQIASADFVRVYLAYTIPAGTLNKDHYTARYRLPGALRLTENRVEAINKSKNGISKEMEASTEITRSSTDADFEEDFPTDEETWLGAEAIEGTRSPDRILDKAETEYISATVKVENIYKSGEYRGQDLIFTFTPYTVRKNQTTYDADGKTLAEGEKVRGFFSLDFNPDQISCDESGTAEILFAKESDVNDVASGQFAQKEIRRVLHLKDSQNSISGNGAIGEDATDTAAEAVNTDNTEQDRTEKKQTGKGNQTEENKDGTDAVTADQKDGLAAAEEKFLTGSVIAASGEAYEINVTYGEDAQIPDGSELRVREILESDSEYKDYSEQAVEKVEEVAAQIAEENADAGDNAAAKADSSTGNADGNNPDGQALPRKSNGYVRVFDIEIWYNGQKIEPEEEVLVEIRLLDAPENKETSLDVVHFAEDGPEVLSTDQNTNTRDTADTSIQFTTDAFSVYTIVGTETLTGGFVSADGKSYEVTVTYGADAGIPNGSTLRLVELAKDSEEYQEAKKTIDTLHDENSEAGDVVDVIEGIDAEAPVTDVDMSTDEDASTDEDTSADEDASIESEDDAYFASVTKENEIIEGFSALDISILDPEGNVIEPKGEVTVSIVMKSLPEGMNEADLIQNLEVHHLLEEDGKIKPEQVAGASIESSDITANENGAAIEFVTESFSTYTISWENGGQARNIRLHFVDDQGHDIDGFTYNGQSIDNGNTNLATLIPQNGMFNLSNFKKEGYSLSNTHVGQFEDMNNNTPTIIRNEIERADNTVHYWTFNTGNDTAGNTRRDFPTGTTDLYLVYNSTAMSGQGGEGTDPGGDVPDLGAIGNKKEATSNNDGTYKLHLSVTGNAQNKQSDPHVNVIVVFDTSSSMASNYIPNSDSKTRLEAAKDELNEMATELLANNTTAHPDAVEMALVTFNRNAQIISLGESNWTTDAITYTSAVGTYRNGRKIGSSETSAGDTNTGVGIAKGTNWAQGLQKAVDLMGHDEDPTYVLFITDGAPSQYWPSNQATGTYADAEGCYLGARDEARRLVGGEGAIMYGLFAYGSTNDYSKDYLGQLVDYAYNNGSAKDTYRINAADNETLRQKLKEILKAINMNFAYANVEINDGITGLSTVIFEHIDTESFEYTITYRNYTLQTAYTEEELHLTPNADGTVTIPSKTYGVLDNSASGGVKTITTQEVTVEGARFSNTDEKSVVWDMNKAEGEGDAAIYMLENGWTYTVSFDVWPSQTSYDLVAALNNHILEYGDDYHYTDESDNTNHTITFDEYKDQITNTSPYTLLTNTHASVKYQQVTETVDQQGNISYEYGDVKEIPITYTSNMGLVSQQMPVKKEFAHSINAQDPYSRIRFYIMMDDQYYLSNGTLSEDLIPYTESEDGITPALHTLGMDLSSSNNWTGNIYIAPGVIVDERDENGVGNMDVLETGHCYSLYEVITEGNVYEYEFTPQTVRPMVVNGTLKYLVRQDKYNNPASGAKTYPIDGDIYYETTASVQGLIGTNRKTAELDITKIVDDPDDLMTEAEENAETFTYRVTLKIPDKYPNNTPVDPAGIVGYEYVPRTQSNAFTLYGYQTTDTDQGFTEDVERFSGKTFRGWNTLIYRDLAQWANVDGRIVSLKDDDGNVLWKIPAENGYHTITYDMTLKQDEVIRFTNLPSGTIYTIQEIYANKYPADNAGGITSGRPPISEGSNIADEGYEITQIQHTGGTRNGDTITGTIDELDTRFYNQFKNTVKSHKDVSAELKVKKITEYTWPTEQYYRFTLAAGTAAYTDGTTGISPMPETIAENTDSVVDVYDDDRTPDHTTTFGTIRYEKAGTYTYTVTESWAPGYAQKPEAATITVTVEAQDDKLVVTNIEDDLGTTDFTAATETNLATGLTTQTNRIKRINVSATKEWVKADGTTVIDTPPAGSKVTFTLYKNNEPTDQSVELDGVIDQAGELEAWVATFSDLPQYTVITNETTTGEGDDAVTTYTNTSELITYTIAETTTCPGFELVTTNPVPDRGVIQNKQLAREVIIQKKNQDASRPLSGAIFSLYTKEGYESTPKADPIQTNLESLATEGKVGLIELGELTYGDYYLVETKAPDGFNLLTDPVGLKVEADIITITQGNSFRVDDAPDDTTYDAFITNSTGYELPHTGGPGTFTYTLGGLMLVIASVLMYGFRMRRRERRLN